MGKWFSSAADGRTDGWRMGQPYLFSPSFSIVDDDADNDEVVITAAAARSEPILTPGRSMRGACYTGAGAISTHCVYFLSHLWTPELVWIL